MSQSAGGNLRRLVGLQHLLAGLAGADADGVLDRQQEDLPVADRAGPRVPQDRFGDHVDRVVVDDALDPELRPQVDRELRTAVVLGDPLLPAGALRLENRERRVTGVEQVLADRLERLVADVGDDHLHDVASAGVADIAVTDAGRGAAPIPSLGILAPYATSSGSGMNCSG